PPPAPRAGARAPGPGGPPGRPVRPLDEVIRTTIEDAIAACDGSIPRAAAALEVSPSTLYRRIQAWNG
ncbi:helix-turn-helix domain-containing protein, partial [Rhodoplanes tepidamans]